MNIIYDFGGEFMSTKIISKEEVFSSFTKRNEDTHKYDFGRALLIVGSEYMTGAAVFAAKGCISSGIGLCEVLTPAASHRIIASHVCEPIYTVINKNDLRNQYQKIKKSIKKADVIVIGCGCGANEYTDFLLNAVLENSKVPVIIDADGINCLARNIDLLKQKNCEVILTPHSGEMSRLTHLSSEYINCNREKVAVEFSKTYGVTVVLKGHNTVISYADDVYVNPTGNSGMATGGSGDLLCGIMAARIAHCYSLKDAINSSVYIHGMCGDISSKRYSMISTTPSTMLECLPEIYLSIESAL